MPCSLFVTLNEDHYHDKQDEQYEENFFGLLDLSDPFAALVYGASAESLGSADTAPAPEFGVACYASRLELVLRDRAFGLKHFR
jgi:hypothetical protein